MDTLIDTQCYYQPVARTLRVANQSYWMIDEKVARQRASVYLNEAKEKMSALEMVTDAVTAKINQALLIAIDFGSAEAAYIMGERILKGTTAEQHSFEDAIFFYGLAAERGHKKAAHCMACCYAGLEHYPELLQAGEHYFAEIDNNDRALLADYYFQQVG